MVEAAEGQLSALDALGGPTFKISETIGPLPMAHVTVHPVRAIEAALREARGKKPGTASFLVTLVGPTVLVAKSVEDLWRSLSKTATGAIEINWLAAVIALGALAIGAGAFSVLLMQLVAASKPSELQNLAKDHVNDWLREMGQGPREHDPPGV